jgi:HK97 family phage major capsid protein
VDESDITWDSVSLNCKKVMTMGRLSSEISEDALISIADRFSFEMALAFSAKEDSCGLNGTGSSSYGQLYWCWRQASNP